MRSTRARTTNRDYVAVLEPGDDGNVVTLEGVEPELAAQLLKAERVWQVANQVPVRVVREGERLRLTPAPPTQKQEGGDVIATAPGPEGEPIVIAFDSTH